MSVLTPLYLLGLAAVSLPLLFHLVRRTPRGEMQFSSLMFLQPSPPRLTKRSRLENVLLLILRGLVLTLLAFAFARPFFRQAAVVTPEDVEWQRVAVLVDTSASMRRADLWQQAVAAVDRTLATYRPQDRVAVYAFDETLRPIASYQQLSKLEPGRRRPTVAQLMNDVGPTWGGTRLGQALADALAALAEMEDEGAADAAAPRRIVLISDLQSGSHLDAFGEYDWPDDAQLQLIGLTLSDETNAGLELLGQQVAAQDEFEARDQRLRVRVANAANSMADSFRLEWRNEAGDSIGEGIDVYAPAGESRVARIPLPTDAGSHPRLVLEGDKSHFDNTIYYVPPNEDKRSVVYLGDDDPQDAEGMAYYLHRAVGSDATRDVEVTMRKPGEQMLDGTEPPQLVVVTSPPTGSQAIELRRYLDQGGTVLYVATSELDASPLGSLLGMPDPKITATEPDDYAMLGEIQFDHRVFSDMAGPQFNNFTQILFWKYRRLEESASTGANVLARFDTGDIAMLQKDFDNGELYVMTSGWQPDDSQLARSWKFLLMIAALVDGNRQGSAFEPSYQVNQGVPMPRGIELSDNSTMIKPNGEQVLLAGDSTVLVGIDQPGFYRLNTADGLTEFAVHIDPTESETAPLSREAFERTGVRMTTEFDPAAATAKMQQVRDIELERRQKVWKWLVVLALVALIAETLVAGWLSRPAVSTVAPA